MLPQTSTRRNSRLKMIAGVSVTALLGLGAVLLPNGAERGALAATPSVLLPQLPPFPLPFPFPPLPVKQSSTVTPIKHVIYVIAENRSFDNIYATYRPKNGQQIWNLLSRGIVNADGTPGRNFARGQQFQATSSNGVFALSPLTKAPYAAMPTPTLNSAQALGIGLELDAELAPDHVVFVNPNGTPGPLFPNGDPDLPLKDQITLTTGGFAQAPSPITSTKASGPDIRIPGVMTNTLPAGPFQQTSAELPYDAYAGDTIHQLFQMWQMSDCSMHNATFENPTGCVHDLYPFVAVTNGTAPGSAPGDGGQDMAFFNMQTGDAPIFKALADQYAISDNFHQAIMGGSVTGHFGIAYGDNPFFANSNGTPGTPTGGITNPNPQVGTLNTYVSNGTWVMCNDPTQPGVAPIQSYLASLPYRVGPNCAANSYYPIRDANPGFAVTGALEPANSGTMPPITVRHIGDELNANNISWAFYSGGYNSAVAVANGATDIVDAVLSTGYCAICNPFQYSLSTMSDPNQRAAHLKDIVGDLYPAIANNTLPAVSFVKMDGALQGHPGSGKVSLLEEFVQDIVDRTQANPELFAETAIIVTFDESGGLYDSGFIQPLDFLAMARASRCS
ncbi:MAG: alkaline phosphatase family protein [Bradyrhizobium sp.]